MKWRYVALAIPLLVVALLFVADTYLGRVLAARLPAMLSDALGKPVSSGEIDFELFGLQVRSKELVIGQAGQPALRADDLMVELALGTLLQGGLLFQSITATSVFVDLDQWATSTRYVPPIVVGNETYPSSGTSRSSRPGTSRPPCL